MQWRGLQSLTASLRFPRKVWPEITQPIHAVKVSAVLLTAVLYPRYGRQTVSVHIQYAPEWRSANESLARPAYSGEKLSAVKLEDGYARTVYQFHCITAHTCRWRYIHERTYIQKWSWQPARADPLEEATHRVQLTEYWPNFWPTG